MKWASVGAAVIALFVGIAIGRQFAPHTETKKAISITQPAVDPTIQAAVTTPGKSVGDAASISRKPTASPTEQKIDTSSAKSRDIVTQLKDALNQPGNFHSFATVSRLADSIVGQNLGEVLNYVNSLTRRQEKNQIGRASCRERV